MRRAKRLRISVRRRSPAASAAGSARRGLVSLQLPQLHHIKVLRQWAGICDMTPDFAPVIGAGEELDNFYVDIGWGTYEGGAGRWPVSGGVDCGEESA